MSPRLVIAWHPVEGRQTTCRLAITIDGETAWPVRGEPDVTLEVQIDDLLGHLTDFWKPLMLRQVYPIDVNPLKPSDLRHEAYRHWAEMQPAIVEREDEAVSEFEEAHDLARAFAGVFDLPPFWILRSGGQMILEANGMLWRLPFDSVRADLSAVGDHICQYLTKSDADRWEDAIQAWHRRDDADDAGLLAWSASLDLTLARSLIQDGTLTAPSDFDDAVNDNDELRIAARMAGALPAEQIREIIALARRFGKHDAEDLHQLAKACSDHIAAGFERAKPFIQGEAAARFAREQLGIPGDTKADIFAIVERLGIEVRSGIAEPPSLDGLAIWGRHHGPGAFLNEASRRIRYRNDKKGRIKDSRGARVTLAHELCHLLLDGRHAMSAIEVLRARMPAGIEPRAKSFAGEFLLPSQAAAAVWLEAGKPRGRDGVEAVVIELTSRFGVTRSVAAWKLEHGANPYDRNLVAALNSIAPRR